MRAPPRELRIASARGPPGGEEGALNIILLSPSSPSSPPPRLPTSSCQISIRTTFSRDQRQSSDVAHSINLALCIPQLYRSFYFDYATILINRRSKVLATSSSHVNDQWVFIIFLTTYRENNMRTHHIAWKVRRDANGH